MKKSYIIFMFFCYLVIFFSFCNDVFADDYIYIEPSVIEGKLGKGQDSKFFMSLCGISDDSGNDKGNCGVKCKDGSSSAFGKSYTALLTSCGSKKSNIESYFVTVKTLKGTYYDKSKDITFYKFVKDAYSCSTKSNSDICKKLVDEASKPSDAGFSYLSCTYHVPILGNGASQDFTIMFHNSLAVNNFYAFNYEYSKFDENNLPNKYSNGELETGNYFIHLYGKNSNFSDFKGKFFSDLKNIKEKNNQILCPSTADNYVFCCDLPSNSSKIHLYMDSSGTCPNDVYTGVCKIDIDSSGSGNILYEGSGTNYGSGLIKGKSGDPLEEFDCSIFTETGSDDGKSLGDILSMVINIIKILVPIVLLVLGSIDFVQAIFAQDESAIKKAQSKFIKRLIIAVVIFLIPSILKVILGIANSVWSWISPDFCGIL